MDGPHGRILGRGRGAGPRGAGGERRPAGELAGISVVDGELVSEAVRGRPALVLPHRNGRGASVDRVTTRLRVRAEDGARRRMDGLNRTPGLIFSCGGVDDQPFD